MNEHHCLAIGKDVPDLLATPARYVGLMGSNRRWATTRAKLEDAGVSGDRLDLIKTPIGSERHAENPEEIAVSIMAEVIEHLRGD